VKGLAVFGWLTAAFGAYASLMVLVNVRSQTTSEIVVRFMASAALGLAGVVIARRARPAVPRIDAQEAERQILRAARAHNGRVTATEIAAETSVPLAQASEMLEALAGRGLCQMSVAEAGILVFEFPELESSAEGAASRAAQARAAAQRTTN
jgi:uncharacterized membrane protein